MKQVILSGYYGFNNAGDEAILAALLEGLQRQEAAIETIVLSGNPKWTSKVHQVPAIKRTNLKEVYRQLQRSDLLISGGGSLLQDVTGFKTIPYYLGVIKLAQLLGVPVFFCAQGVGPINSTINQSLVKRVLNQVDYITVRDQESKELLLDLGVNNSIHLTADPVFDLTPVSNNIVEEILKQEKINLTKPILGIAPRWWKDNSYLTQLALILEQIKERLEVDLLLIPLHYPEDLKVSRKLQGLVDCNIELIAGNYTPQEVLGIMGELDLLLGIRLHSLIFAALNQIPLAGISYDPKIDSFLARLDLMPIGEINNLKPLKISNKISRIWANKRQNKQKIVKKIKNLEGLAQQNLEIALRLLGDNHG